MGYDISKNYRKPNIKTPIRCDTELWR